MTLLIVVDMQNDFVTGALGTAEAQAIVPRVNAKIAAADAVVYTLDTHGEDYLATQEGKRLPVPHCIPQLAKFFFLPINKYHIQSP